MNSMVQNQLTAPCRIVQRDAATAAAFLRLPVVFRLWRALILAADAGGAGRASVVRHQPAPETAENKRHDVVDSNKQADAAPRRSEQFLQSTLDALTAHIAIVDEGGTILAVNAAWRRFAEINGLGWPDHGVGRSYLAACDDATERGDSEATAVAAGIRAVLSGEQESFEWEYPCHGPTERRWFVVRISRFVDAGRTRAVVAHENVTARRQAEEEHQAFLDAAAHDLKNPLAGIHVQAQLLRRRMRRGAELSQLEVSVAAIEAAVERTRLIIDELLDVARLRAGQPLEIARAETDLVALARTAIDAQHEMSENHQLRFEATVPQLVGGWDAARLARVLDNLLNNAIKYSPDGGTVTVHVAHEEDGSGSWAVVTVRDDGLGIPAADLPYLFTRFRRGRNVAGRISGSGIGLSGAKQIVEQHGGTITVASEEGQWTTVTVRLPFGVPQAALS